MSDSMPHLAGPSARRRTRIPLLIWASGSVTALFALLAILGQWITPHDPAKQDLLASGQGMSATHLLGTDELGRDILSRVIVGARPALEGPVVVAIGAAAIAISLGLLAGFYGGLAETLIMRAADLVFAIPSLLVIIVTVGLVGGGYWLAAGMLVVLSMPNGLRIIRSSVLGQRNLPYIESARTLGVSDRRLMFVHILPNVLPNVVASFLLDFVGALIALSALSFLGLGSPPGSPDWGRMLTENRTLLQDNPWAAIAPALLLIVAATSVTVMGDWVYGRLEEAGDTHV